MAVISSRIQHVLSQQEKKGIYQVLLQGKIRVDWSKEWLYSKFQLDQNAAHIEEPKVGILHLILLEKRNVNLRMSLKTKMK